MNLFTHTKKRSPTKLCQYQPHWVQVWPRDRSGASAAESCSPPGGPGRVQTVKVKFKLENVQNERFVFRSASKFGLRNRNFEAYEYEQ